MGFFDGLVRGLGAVAKEAGKQIASTAKECSENRERFASYSDERLASIWKRGSFAEKTAAWGILRERLGEEGAKDIIRRAY